MRVGIYLSVMIHQIMLSVHFPVTSKTTFENESTSSKRRQLRQGRHTGTIPYHMRRFHWWPRAQVDN